jgi:hypothetical protein
MSASRSSEESQLQQKMAEKIKRKKRSTLSRTRLSWSHNGLTRSRKEIETGHTIKMAS